MLVNSIERPMSQGFVTDVASWYIGSCRLSTNAAPIRVIPAHTASTGIISSRLHSFEGNCRNAVPSRYDNDAEVLMPSFHPRNGFATEVSTMDGRTIAIGSPAPCFAISDSARLLVKVYVFGQPNSLARRVASSVR